LQLSDEDLEVAANKLHDAYSDGINSDFVLEVLEEFLNEFRTEIEASNSIYWTYKES
jgi:hypothetical protein